MLDVLKHVVFTVGRWTVSAYFCRCKTL